MPALVDSSGDGVGEDAAGREVGAAFSDLQRFDRLSLVGGKDSLGWDQPEPSVAGNEALPGCCEAGAQGFGGGGEPLEFPAEGCGEVVAFDPTAGLREGGFERDVVGRWGRSFGAIEEEGRFDAEGVADANEVAEGEVVVAPAVFERTDCL